MDPKILLRKLQDYYARHRDIPSISALSLIMGASENSIARSLSALASEGLLRGNSDFYEPSERFFESSLASDAIPAGAPARIPADGVRDSINIHSYLVRHPSQTIMIPVRGDSMVDAGICDGDIAIVEVGRAGLVGDIVVARVDGEFTLKRLAKKGAKIVLRPENKLYSDIIPAAELEIQGVVIGIVRKYLH